MSDTLLRALDLIGPYDLVRYHGSKTSEHGLYLAVPCACVNCARYDALGDTDTRYMLLDPWAPRCPVVLQDVRRESITRSTATT